MAQSFSLMTSDPRESEALDMLASSIYQSAEAGSRPSVSAIVPVFDEEKTLCVVVETLLHSDLIDEVICINDGSTDGSLALLKKFGERITLIDLEHNRGKGYALAAGIHAAAGELVAFFDADLANLSDAYIEALLAPILHGGARAVLGYPTKASALPTVFANLTGERAYYRRDLLPYLARMEASRFGVEVLLNDAFFEHQPIKVPLIGLRGLYKYEKHAPTRAVREYLGAAIEIAQEIGRLDGILPEDRQLLAGLADVTNFEEFSRRIGQLRNIPIRRFLERYILSYLNR